MTGARGRLTQGPFFIAIYEGLGGSQTNFRFSIRAEVPFYLHVLGHFPRKRPFYLHFHKVRLYRYILWKVATWSFVAPYSTFRQLAPPGTRGILTEGPFLLLFTRVLEGLKLSTSDKSRGTILPDVFEAFPEKSHFTCIFAMSVFTAIFARVLEGLQKPCFR